MKAWLAYAVVAAALLGLLATGLSLLLDDAATPALWLAAGVAYAIQLLAFGALVAGRDTGTGFIVGWGGGMALRLAAVAAMAFWVTQRSTLPAAPALVGLVGFVFILVLLEPVFLRLIR
ncbi:MAG TPA: hypothetical protein VMK65_00525 [Longimicrobiales bacterium]|nr:hypothetical protein [Longimicrobiales bacterium]